MSKVMSCVLFLKLTVNFLLESFHYKFPLCRIETWFTHCFQPIFFYIVVSFVIICDIHMCSNVFPVVQSYSSESINFERVHFDEIIFAAFGGTHFV